MRQAASQPRTGHGFVLNLLPYLMSWEEDGSVAVFDGEGRLYSLYEGQNLYRRGLDSSVLCTERRPSGDRLVRRYRRLTGAEAVQILTAARDRAARLGERLGRQPATFPQKAAVEARLAEILSYSPEKLLAERERFREVYKPVSVLPPDQYMSVVVQLTEGCPYNGCTFCDLYQDRSFHTKSPAELEEHLDRLVAFFGRALPMRKGVFLGDGNCLAVPAPRLTPLLRILNQRLGGHPVREKGIFSFADVRAVLHQAVSDLEQLYTLGLKRVYLGLETGSDRLLAYLNKPSLTGEQVEAVTRLKSAHLSVGLVFMVGVGGSKYYDEHVEETIRLVNALPLGTGDLVYLSRFYPIKDTPYADDVSRQEIDLLPEGRLFEQTERIKSGIAPTLKKGAKTAPYDLAGFVY